MPQRDGAERLRDTEGFFHYLFSGVSREIESYIAFSRFDTKTTKWFNVQDTEPVVWARHVQKVSKETDVYFGTCLYAAPSPGRGSVNSALFVPGLWFDIDIKGAAHKGENLPESRDEVLEALFSLCGCQPSLIVDSGHGLQLWWLFEKPYHITDELRRQEIMDASREFQTTLIAGFEEAHGWKFDNTSDLARVFRPPGSVNHKQDPVEVFVIGGREKASKKPQRYTLSDLIPPSAIHTHTHTHAQTSPEPPQASPPSKRPPTPEPPSDTPEYPPCSMEPILTGCAWMQHCYDDQKTLSEPEWLAMLTIVAKVDDAPAHADKMSQSYDGYTAEATMDKLYHASKMGPRTCKRVEQDFSGYCKTCAFKAEGDLITTPLTIGQYPGPSPDLIQTALDVVSEMQKKVTDGEADPYTKEVIEAVQVVQAGAPGKWAEIKKDLSKAGVSIRTLNSEVKAMQATKQAELTTPMVVDDESKNKGVYTVVKGAICRRKPIADNQTVLEALCNFSAKIIAEETRDDGQEERRIFLVEGKLCDGTPLPVVEVSASEFNGLGWVSSGWGAKAIVFAGPSTKDHLRAAIQWLSRNDVVTRRTYTHTGWRNIEKKWVYLHNGTAGNVAHVSLDSFPMSEYSLAPVSAQPTAPPLKKLFKVAPAPIITAILASVHRAVLGECLPVDYSLFFAGPSGVGKSELAAIAQSFWGSTWSSRHLPGNWSSTSNSNERTSFLIKDAVYVVDDFAPGGGADPSRLHRDAERLLRAQGNLSGRGRLTAEAGARAVYSPRGLIVATGEDVPRGQSIRARLVVIEINHVDLNWSALTEVQDLCRQGIFADWMGQFTSWLAGRLPTIKKEIVAQHRVLREEAANLKSVHTRTPDIQASLALGYRYMVDCLIDLQYTTPEAGSQMLEDGWDNLSRLVQSQGSHVSSEDVTVRFLSVLRSALMNRAHLTTNTEGAEPALESHVWGWKRGDNKYSNEPRGEHIGWINTAQDEIWLEPEAAFAVVQKLAREQGNPMNINQATLWKRLHEKDHIARTTADSLTLVARCENRSRRVIALRVSSLYNAPDDDAVTDDEPALALESGPEEPW